MAEKSMKRFMKLDDDYHQDNKIISLRMKGGQQYEGTYIALSSYHSIYETNDYEIPYRDVPQIAYAIIGESKEVVNDVISFCLETGLFVDDPDRKSFYSPRRKESLKEMDSLIQKRREAGKRGGSVKRQKSNSQADEKQKTSNCLTNAKQELNKCQAEEEEEEEEEYRENSRDKSIELNSSHSYSTRECGEKLPENEVVSPEKPEKTSKGKKSTSLNHPSSLDEVKEYAREMGYTYCNCREWWDFNEARGWILSNGRPIKDWKAQLRYSYSRGYSRSKETEDSYDGRPFNPNLHNSTDEELETMFMTDEEKAEWEAKKKAGEKNVGA